MHVSANAIRRISMITGGLELGSSNSHSSAVKGHSQDLHKPDENVWEILYHVTIDVMSWYYRQWSAIWSLPKCRKNFGPKTHMLKGSCRFLYPQLPNRKLFAPCLTAISSALRYGADPGNLALARKHPPCSIWKTLTVAGWASGQHSYRS